MTEDRCWRIERSKYESEADLQKAVNECLDILQAQMVLYYFHAGDYEGKTRDHNVISDLLIYPIRFNSHPFSIELKTPKGNGEFTDGQKVFNYYMSRCKRATHYVVNCFQHVNMIISLTLSGNAIEYIRDATGCYLNFHEEDLLSPEAYLLKLERKKDRKRRRRRRQRQGS